MEKRYAKEIINWAEDAKQTFYNNFKKKICF